MHDIIDMLRKMQRGLGITRATCPSDEYAVRCYSQEGEDLVLQRIFGQKNIGYYVDVGAHHPQRFSNTYLLYRQGWRGINIDATPGAMILFEQMRPEDINLEIGIAEKDGRRELYLFEEPALNTFDAKTAEENIAFGCRLLGKVFVRVSPLASILDEHMPQGAALDLLTIDIEGLDEVVLSTFDLKKYAPAVVICERTSSDLKALMGSMTAARLHGQGYTLYSKLFHSSIWVRGDIKI